MSRQYVHLSTETEQARIVGRRHHYSPVILTVRARDAWQAGVVFHVPEPRLYISGPIPPEFVALAGTEGVIP
jgi:putative RNA 2'-phosphotransferase